MPAPSVLSNMGEPQEFPHRTIMVAELKRKLITLYDTDYNLWVFETVKKLERKDYDSIDWDNLIEEILDLSKRDIAVCRIM